MVPFSRRADRYASHHEVYVGCATGAIQRKSTGSPGLQLVDQRLNLAAVVLYVGIEIRTSSHDHADALDLDVGDTQPRRELADLPVELDGLAVGLIEAAVDDEDAVGPGRRLADGKRLLIIGTEQGKRLRAYVTGVAESTPRPISPEGITYASNQLALSPDGSRVHFSLIVIRGNNLPPLMEANLLWLVRHTS